jgi:hypothetical protein
VSVPLLATAGALGDRERHLLSVCFAVLPGTLTDCTSPGGDADATGSGSCSINRRLGGGGNGGAVPVVVLLAGLAAVTVVVVVTTRSDAVASRKRL